MTEYTKKDAQKDTDSSRREVSRAFHTARDDSGAREGKDKELLKSPPDWAKDMKTEGGIPLFPANKK
jgi:hypothetical protein